MGGGRRVVVGYGKRVEGVLVMEGSQSQIKRNRADCWDAGVDASSTYRSYAYDVLALIMSVGLDNPG